jgi:predicted lipoprotein with Yx(FWY)xxD motif
MVGMMSYRAVRLVIPGALLALLVAACGHKGTTTAGSSPNAGGSSAMATVNSTDISGTGRVLVNGDGRTLYMLTADKGGKVTCTSTECTAAWPPLLLSAGESAPVGGGGVTASMLGTAKTPSGKMQVTYNSWPLYTFSGDAAAGQVNGQGIKSFGGVWHPLAPSGQPLTGSASSGGGGGY